MKRSTDRILTTHTGSLPRPEALVDALYAKEEQRLEESEEAFAARVHDAVVDVVDHQTAIGLDVVNDGEMGRLSYYSYLYDRMDGFGGQAPPDLGAKDLADFPDFARVRTSSAVRTRVKARRPACIGPVSYTRSGKAALELDIENLKDAVSRAGRAPQEVFMSSASPGVTALFMQNQYYPSHEAYVAALADALKTEYDAIAQAGFLLQLDCPDLAMGANTVFKDQDREAFRTTAQLHLEAIAHATRDIPEDRIRIHLCWGNYEGPHHHDIPITWIADLVLASRATAVSFEAANPRHEHEFTAWDEVKLPDGKILMPGVLDSTTNFIEHPELVALRIQRFAERVGRENVIPGTDCGFATGAGMGAVHPDIAWAKLESLVEGARLASKRLWS